jgi:hypothetical protein
MKNKPEPIIGAPETVSQPEPVAQKAMSPYGDIIVTAPKTQTVSEKFGSKSVATVQCSVPLPHAGIVISATLWTRLKGDTFSNDLSIGRDLAYMSDEDKVRFREACDAAMGAWPRIDIALANAEKLLLGVPLETKTDSRFAPRHVKR